jgi:hypothetical protein
MAGSRSTLFQWEQQNDLTTVLAAAISLVKAAVQGKSPLECWALKDSLR